MARPNLKKEEKGALGKLEEAFWTLLEEEDYKDLSVKLISLEAKVNHNSFYYYFRNVDDMARYCFVKLYEEGVMPDENLVFDEKVYKLGDGSDNEEAYRRWSRLSLFACKDSLLLLTIFKETMLQSLLKRIDVPFPSLSEDEKIELSFILAGASEAIAFSRRTNNPSVLYRVGKTEIGESIIKIMRRIRRNHRLDHTDKAP